LGCVAADHYLPAFQLRTIVQHAVALGSIDWRTAPEQWVKRSGHSLETWTWWAEGAMQSPMATSPGPIWRLIADHLDPNEPSAWSLWSRYPECLPERAQAAVLAAPKTPSGLDWSWLFDFAGSVSPEKIRRSNNLQLSRLRLSTCEGHLSLKDWALSTEWLWSQNAFDPRAGEWTALRIAQQAVEAATSDESRPFLHWSTVFVSEKWLEPIDAQLRWDQWQDIVEKMPVCLKAPRREEGADQGEVAPRRVWTDQDFCQVQEAGQLLLGLLRRNFRWPAGWRSREMLADVGWVSRAAIREAHASSWTTGILEACLLPRQRENVLLSSSFFGALRSDDDTTEDPPLIPTLRQLRRFLGVAIATLEKGQVTVRDHQPRQLVPLRVEQLSRAEWGMEYDAPQASEEDDQ